MTASTGCTPGATSRRSSSREAVMPRLSVFPKCYMDALCVTKTMTLFEWIDLAATLDVDGVEMYPGFFESFEPPYLERVAAHLEKAGLEAPMMCASPDFTQPDAAARRAEVERERHMIDVTARLGGEVLPRPVRTAPGGGLARGRRALDGRVHQRPSSTPRRRGGSSSTWRTTTRTDTGGSPSSPRAWTCSWRSSAASTRRGSGSTTTPPTRSWPATTRWPCWPR